MRDKRVEVSADSLALCMRCIGLGAAMARRFHEEGAKVIVNDLVHDSAAKVAEEVDGLAIGCDVADSAAVRDMFQKVGAEYGRLDILVNNAEIGVQNDEFTEKFVQRSLAQVEELGAGGPIKTHLDCTVDLSDEEWLRMIAVHLNGTFFCTREALKIMNPQLSGAIINLGSIMGTTGGAGLPDYCAAKGGILAFTRSLAREVASRSIRVNAIAPGWIDTAMTDPLADVRPILEAQTPLGRFGEPDDISWAAVYLASDEAKFVTGQVLSPNGGWYMSQ